ncbi:MAG: ThiF family adenylyltransferase [Candidatus Omnitrophota bacterium]
MFKLSLSGSQLQRIQQTIPDGKEEICYCLGYFSDRKGIIKFVLKPEQKEMLRNEAYVKTDINFDCKLYNLLIKERTPLVVQAHWHKFTDRAWFSGIDDKGAEKLYKNTRKFIEKPQIVQIVFTSSRDFAARLYKPRFPFGFGSFHYFKEMEVVGKNGIYSVGKEKKVEPNLSGVFEKNTLAFSEKGMEKITRAKVLVIGAGGLGSALLYQLIRIGFSIIEIVDNDVIEKSNCNRLYFVDDPEKAIGNRKVGFIAQAIKRFNRKARVKTHYKEFRDEDRKISDAVKRADIVLLAVDNDRTRVSVNRICAQYAKPLVNVATGIYMDEKGEKIAAAGCQIQTFLPREEGYPCFECCGGLNQDEIQQELMDEHLKEMRKKAGYIAHTSLSPTPQVIPLNTIAAGIASWEIACWIAGIKPIEKWIYYDGIKNDIRKFAPTKNPECSCCGLGENSILALCDFQPELTKMLAK